MLNLLISCDDPMERLLYGEPDPWLRSFECRVTPGTPGWNDLSPEDQQRILDYVNSGGALTPEQQEWLNQSYDQGAPEPSSGVDIQDGDAIAERQREWGREWDEQQETYDSYAAGTGGYEPAGSTSAPERQVDAFLVDQAQPDGADAADLLRLDSSPRSHSDTSEARATPDRPKARGEKRPDKVEELIRRRGRALGLSEAQIVSAIARYRTSAGRLRVGAASGGLANAADPATALLGAGALDGGGPGVSGSASVRQVGGDGPRVNPEYEAWQARNQAPQYLNRDGTPVDWDSLNIGNWYPGKESLEDYAARKGMNVVSNPNYVAPGERPNQYLDGSGQPVPETWEQAVAAYQQDGEPLRQDVAQYETAAAAYRTDFDAYEAAVNARNENPGSAEELKALQDRRERLATEQARPLCIRRRHQRPGPRLVRPPHRTSMTWRNWNPRNATGSYAPPLGRRKCGKPTIRRRWRTITLGGMFPGPIPRMPPGNISRAH